MAIAIFTTWTTYGVWLPGDSRGWFYRGRLRAPNELREIDASMRMNHDAVTLEPRHSMIVQNTIADHCSRRNWLLHAVNCRTNHVHVVLTANCKINIPRTQFKSWATRKLDEDAKAAGTGVPGEWWTQRGWDEYVDDMKSLKTVITYVRDGQ